MRPTDGERGGGPADSTSPLELRADRGLGDSLVATYRDHSRAVFNLARQVCGIGHAEDVTQVVFLRFWRHPGRFDPARGSLRSYLLMITHSSAVDAVRSSESRRGREERATGSAIAATDDVADRIEADEDAARVRAALSSLPPTERDAIATAFYGDCSYREAALALDEPEGTIKSRIRSGLRRLGPLLVDLS